MFIKIYNARSWVPSAYFIQGLPAAIIMQLSVIMYKQMGLSNSLSALFSSLLVLPWVCKIFIAPLIERYLSKKSWMMLMQAGFVIAMGLFIVSFYGNNALLLSSLCLVLLGLFSATYDIASDGIYIQQLNEKEQAFFVGIKTLCYHSANLVTKTGVLWLVGLLSVHYSLQGAWQIALLPVLLTFLLLAAYHFIVVPGDGKKQANTLTFFGIIKQASRIPDLAWVLFFVLLFQAPFYMVHKVSPLFFMDSVAQGGLNLPMSKVAALYGLFGPICFLSASFLSGLLLSKKVVRIRLAPWSLLLACSHGLFLCINASDPFVIQVMIYGVTKFVAGLVTAQYMFALLKIANHSQLKTTAYAIITTVMLFSSLFFGAISGLLQTLLGYHDFFLMLIAINCVIVGFTAMLQRRSSVI